MATQAIFLTRMRTLLQDEAIPYTWSDAVLRLCLDDALLEYSMQFPRVVRVPFDTTAGQTEVDLTGGLLTDGYRLLDVVGVACPPTRVLGRDPQVPDEPQLTLAGFEEGWQAYTLVGTTLYFRYPLAGAEVGTGALLVTVRETWLLFDPDAADSATWDGPRFDEGLVLNLAVRQAWRQVALLGIKVAGDSDPGAQVAALSVQIAGQVRARQARPTSRLLGQD